ncbi:MULTISPECIES: TetR/AcrR family transcriptional regulator [Streptomyces]|uniref:TetR/AcrR family transcriptional regulator n=1 Tax=Streptomyces TaxID=1883 RepID=UPI0021D0D0F9|nr:TetR/AcrR family transcriptional regulator [Streptomyces sp. NEAU-383]
MPTTPSRQAQQGGAARTAPRRRADAERSIVSIVTAGLECFREDPNASMTAVARAAGVSRVTLYSHFPSREELFEAVLAHSVNEADKALEAQDLDGGPADEAMVRMVHSCWRILDQHSFLVTASEGLVGEPRRRRQHRKVLDRVDRLIARGQDEGVFRTDLPRTWLVTVFYSLLHTASSETSARRLRAGEAASILERTLLASLRCPGA